MKYEFKKQAMTKYIMLILMAIIEVIFLIGLIVKNNENLIAVPMVIMIMITIVAIFFVSVESIFTFSNDLKTKASYMLFMTPHSSYTIIGAKLLVSFITLFLTGMVLLLINTGNFVLLGARMEGFAQVRDVIAMLLKEIWRIEINFYDVFKFILLLLIGFAIFITTAFVSITISSTVLANKRFKGLVSFAVFIALNLVFTWISNNILATDIWSNSYFLISMGINLIFLIATYLGTAWLLEKKISL